MVIFKYRELRHFNKRDLETICYTICTRSSSMTGGISEGTESNSSSFLLAWSSLPSASRRDCTCSPQELPWGSHTVPVFWVSFPCIILGCPQRSLLPEFQLNQCTAKQNFSFLLPSCMLPQEKVAAIPLKNITGGQEKQRRWKSESLTNTWYKWASYTDMSRHWCYIDLIWPKAFGKCAWVTLCSLLSHWMQQKKGLEKADVIAVVWGQQKKMC